MGFNSGFKGFINLEIDFGILTIIVPVLAVTVSC